MSHDEAAYMDKLREYLASDTVLTRPNPAKNGINAQSRRRFIEILTDVYGSHCWLCNRNIVDEVPTLDHIVPRSKGGRNAIVNVRLAHSICNHRRGNGPIPVLLLTNDMRMPNYPTIPSS